MACTLKDPHDCATVRQANDALRRHLDRACDTRDKVVAALRELVDAYNEGFREDHLYELIERSSSLLEPIP